MTTVNRSNEWFGSKINAGEEFSGSINISESYAGADITIPVHVCRGKKEGPTVCITGAIHGDEINGTGTIRHIIRDVSAQQVQSGYAIAGWGPTGEDPALYWGQLRYAP